MTAEPDGARFRLDRARLQHGAAPRGLAGAGYLVEWDETAVLLDVGQGVIRRLQRLMDPTDLSGRRDRAHARRPLPGPRRPALPVPVGRGRPPDPPAGPPAAGRAGPAGCPGDRRSRNVPASSTPPSTSREYDPEVAARGRPLCASGSCAAGTTSRPGASRRGARRRAGSSTPAIPGRATSGRRARGVDLLLVEAALRRCRPRRPRARPPHRRGGDRHGRRSRGAARPCSSTTRRPVAPSSGPVRRRRPVRSGRRSPG